MSLSYDDHYHQYDDHEFAAVMAAERRIDCGDDGVNDARERERKREREGRMEREREKKRVKAFK